jgi:nucleoside-diphosphate-sugar epimerase
MRNILICGSSGPISNFLNKLLLRLDCKVYIIGRNYFYNNNFFYESDISNVYFSDIFFLNSSLKVSNDFDNIQLNSLPELKMLSSIFQNLKFNRLIYFSSSGAIYGSSNDLLTELSPRLPVSNYGKSKLLIEDYITKYSSEINFKSLILRISNPYGVYSEELFNYGLIPKIFNSCFKGNELFVFTDINYRKDYICVELLNQLFLRIFFMTETSGIYNIGSGVSFSIAKLISLIEYITNNICNVKIIDGIKAIDTDIACLDVSKFLSDFNIECSSNFESNIKKMADFYRRNINVT